MASVDLPLWTLEGPLEAFHKSSLFSLRSDVSGVDLRKEKSSSIRFHGHINMGKGEFNGR